ncbi:Oxygen regulatory protein NreC [compost metagenome]
MPDNEIDFSLRELEILQLIAEGLTNLEMSEKLFLSKRTIEGHRQSLLDKTGSKNSAALIRYGVINGLIQ